MKTDPFSAVGSAAGVAAAGFFVRVLLVLALLAPAPALGASFLERAQQYFEEGDFSSAAVELKNALQRNPDNASARFLLGKVFLKSGDPVSAEKELLRAKDLGLVSEELDLMLTYARLDQRRFDEIVAELPDELKIESLLQQDLFVARGEALLGLGQLDEAQAIFDRILREGEHARALVNKARISMILNDPAAARDLLDRAALVDSDDPLLAMVEAGWLFQSQRFAEARSAFARAASLNPNNLTPHVGMVQSHLALREFEQAEQLVTSFKSANPNNSLFVLLDAVTQFLQGDFQEAKVAADRVLAINDKQPQALLVAGYSAYTLGGYEQARANLQAYLAQRPQDDNVRMLLGATMLKLGYSDQAFGTLGLPESEIPDRTEYLDLLVGAAFGSGEQEIGLKYLEQLVAKEPESARTQERLGIARIGGGDLSGAESAFEKAISLEPSRHTAYDNLFGLYLQQNRLTDALDLGRQLQEQAPERGLGHTLMGLAHLSNSDRESAKTSFERALSLEPETVEAAINLANIYRLEGELDKARGVLDGALSSNSGHLAALLTYSALETSAGNQSRAQQLLLEAAERNPDALQPRQVLGRMYLGADRPEEALALVQPALAVNPDNPGLLEIVGLAKLQTGAAASGLQTIQRLVRVAPDSPRSHENLMEALERNGRIEEALSAADRALELDPTIARARFGRARYLAQLGRFQEANAELKALRRDYPQQAGLLSIEARIALSEKRVEDAVGLFERAFELQPENTKLVELVRVKVAVGKVNEALLLMRKWLEDRPDDQLIRNTLAEVFIGIGQFGEAKEQYRAILAKIPNNPRLLNNMAWVQTALGEEEDAVENARHALRLDPGNHTYVSTLAGALLQAGRGDEALDILEDVAREVPKNPSLQFHYAWALAESGERDEAVDALHALLQSDKPFLERARAEQLLESLN